MPDMTASYGTPFDFIAFFGCFHTFLMPELLYFHQTFTNCISNQYLYVEMPDVTASYGMPLSSITFFCEFCTKLTNIHF